MEELNKKKKALVNKFLLFITIAILLLFVGILVFPLIIIAIVCFILAFSYSSKIRQLDFSFKENVMNHLAKEIFLNASYIKEGYISREEYRLSEFSGTGDSFSCTDTIFGTYKGLKFDASEIKITETHHNGKTSYTITLFDGLFVRIESDKKEKGKVKLSERNSKSLFDGYSKVEFESIEFNRAFNCLTTDEHLAFYLTNPKFMDELLDLEKTYPGDFYLLYNNGLIYLLINNISFNFDVKLTETYNEELIKQYRNNLLHIRNLIEAL